MCRPELCLFATLLTLPFTDPGAMLAKADERNWANPLQFSIDALTRADTCLYMLQSTRDPATGDCRLLQDFHAQEFLDWNPDLTALEESTRRRVVNNRKAYLQTLKDIEREKQRLE
ncbi:MAG: hypothetical protein AB8B57_14210 [Congregibacter sp.]